MRPVNKIEGTWTLTKFILSIDVEPLLLAHQSFIEALSQVTTELTRDGAIQRFEYTFELAWKTMKRLLRAKGSEVNHPRDVFREAAADHLIFNPSAWFVFLEKRNKSTHIYKKEVAEEVFAEMPNFAVAMNDFITRLNLLDAVKKQ
jgi:nucleotidyltransferase substrate binding protein (TIGR01987 family)